MNPIELCWSIVKRKFRSDLTRQLVGTLIPEKFEVTVSRAMRCLTRKQIKSCCLNGFKEIKDWKPNERKEA